MVSPVLQQSCESAHALDKYNFNTIFEGTESQNDDEFQCFLAQIHYFEKSEIECSPYFKGVKGRLAKHLESWIKTEARDFEIVTIRNGYVIQFWTP